MLDRRRRVAPRAVEPGVLGESTRGPAAHPPRASPPGSNWAEKTAKASGRGADPPPEVPPPAVDEVAHSLTPAARAWTRRPPPREGQGRPAGREGDEGGRARATARDAAPV